MGAFNKLLLWISCNKHGTFMASFENHPGARKWVLLLEVVGSPDGALPKNESMYVAHNFSI